MRALSLCSPLDNSESEPMLQPRSEEMAQKEPGTGQELSCRATCGPSTRALSLSSRLSSSESKPRLKPQPEKRQCLKQDEPARTTPAQHGVQQLHWQVILSTSPLNSRRQLLVLLYQLRARPNG